MSFDLFIGCFENGEPAFFPLRLVVDAFASHITSRDDKCLTVAYGQEPEDCSYVYVDSKAPLIDAFSVNRPTADIRFYDTLVSILQSANLALYMPGDCPPLIARAEVIPHLPASMVEALGAPRVVGTGAEIVAEIASN
jgi:hypothetical protein